MALKNLLAGLLLAAPLALAHPAGEKVYAHRALPLERKSLNHCQKRFSEPEFIKRTVESHGRELTRLRRKRGLEVDVK